MLLTSQSRGTGGYGSTPDIPLKSPFSDRACLIVHDRHDKRLRFFSRFSRLVLVLPIPLCFYSVFRSKRPFPSFPGYIPNSIESLKNLKFWNNPTLLLITSSSLTSLMFFSCSSERSTVSIRRNGTCTKSHLSSLSCHPWNTCFVLNQFQLVFSLHVSRDTLVLGVTSPPSSAFLPRHTSFFLNQYPLVLLFVSFVTHRYW